MEGMQRAVSAGSGVYRREYALVRRASLAEALKNSAAGTARLAFQLLDFPRNNQLWRNRIDNACGASLRMNNTIETYEFDQVKALADRAVGLYGRVDF